MKLAGKYQGSGLEREPWTSFQPAFKMEPGYIPDHFPNQQKMQMLAASTKNQELQNAYLDFQYPFRTQDLMGSSYSNNVKQAVLQAVTG